MGCAVLFTPARRPTQVEILLGNVQHDSSPCVSMRPHASSCDQLGPRSLPSPGVSTCVLLSASASTPKRQTPTPVPKTPCDASLISSLHCRPGVVLNVAMPSWLLTALLLLLLPLLVVQSTLKVGHTERKAH